MILAEFKDKRVLLETSTNLWGFPSLMERLGLTVVPDNYQPDTPLLEKYTDSKANAALWSVLFDGDQDKILELPDQIQKSFVVVKNRRAKPKIYEVLDRRGLASIYDFDPHVMESLKSAFLHALTSA